MPWHFDGHNVERAREEREELVKGPRIVHPAVNCQHTCPRRITPGFPLKYSAEISLKLVRPILIPTVFNPVILIPPQGAQVLNAGISGYSISEHPLIKYIRNAPIMPTT
jgi:hypothetical protein